MIDQAAFNRLQEFALAVFGPVAQYLFVVYAAAIVALIMFMLALALLRRMLNP